ncbi:MAG: 50S ribosomal protein L18e [Nitrososphaerales archaeon]|nr:50S ribosomal protein L18e [Nitrososphaerales archaeon]
MLERAGKEHKAAIWEKASQALRRPTSGKVEVNLGRISMLAESGEALFVPGKVLGSGLIDKKLFIGAFAFSASARKKIVAKGGSAMTVEQFLKKYPKGGGVTIVE